MTTLDRRSLLQLASAPLMWSAWPAFGQAAYPDKPVRLVVGFPPGQSSDALARNFAIVLARELGQPFYVDNRAGAGGALGAQDVKASKPDGYTLLFGTSGQLAINPSLYRKLAYDTLKDFAPIGLVIKGQLYLVAHPAFPPNNVQELVAYARANPGKVDYGSGGNGVTGHLAMEMLKNSAGIVLNHIPYKGSPAAFNDLMGGQIPLMIDSYAVLPHVKAGKLKVLGTTGSLRSAALPDVPTIAEQGIKGFEAVAWNGFVAPAGTPPAIVEKLSLAVRKACADPLIVDSMRLAGAEITPSTPSEFASFLQGELKKWAAAVALAGVQLD